MVTSARQCNAIIGIKISHQRQILAGAGIHEVQKVLVEANIIHELSCGIAVASDGLNILCATQTHHHPAVPVKFVAFGVAAKVVVVIQYQHFCLWTHLLPVKMGSGETTHARAHHDQIVVLVQNLIVSGFFTPPTEGVSDFIGSLVATTHARQARRVVAARRGR